jgi:hypothetical protein
LRCHRQRDAGDRCDHHPLVTCAHVVNRASVILNEVRAFAHLATVLFLPCPCKGARRRYENRALRMCGLEVGAGAGGQSDAKNGARARWTNASAVWFIDDLGRVREGKDFERLGERGEVGRRSASEIASKPVARRRIAKPIRVSDGLAASVPPAF